MKFEQKFRLAAEQTPLPSFSRSQPEATRFSEKPMARWASGKIKRIYDSYGAFCEEIERLLGEPQEKPHVSGDLSPEMIDEFDLLWQPGQNAEENSQQLLTMLSGFYKAGFILKNEQGRSVIRSFFADDPLSDYTSHLARPFERLVPEIKSEEDLKPIPLSVQPIIDRLGLKHLGWEENFSVHFWLDPDSELSLLLITDTKNTPKEKTRQILLKTQNLIQRRFYD